MITLLLFIVGTAVLAPLIQRDCRRAVQRQEFRRRLAIRNQAVINVQLYANTLAFAEAMTKTAEAFAKAGVSFRALERALKQEDPE